MPRAGTEKGWRQVIARLAIALFFAGVFPQLALAETVCELLGQISARKGKTVQVSGIYTFGDPDNALFSQLECARPPRTDAFVWASGVVLVFPKDKTGEDSFPGPAGKSFEEYKREGGRFQLMVRGILRTKPAYFVGTDPSTGQPLPQGFGESKGYYAELIVSQIVLVRKVE